MTHGSLFSGIGGFDLAAEWMGWENVFHCEWNDFGKRVLNYYWPWAVSYHDITKTDFTVHRGTIDVLTGGFPCQPYSIAGKRKGKEDDRHLWPDMLRAIREIQPRYVVGENVRGIVSWGGGMVFDEVQFDLETAFQKSDTYGQIHGEGYEVIPFILPACAVNAPHRRDRVWFVAHNNRLGSGTCVGKENYHNEREAGEHLEKRHQIRIEDNPNGNTRTATDSSNSRPEGLRPERENEVHEFKTFADTCCDRGRKSQQEPKSKQFNEDGNEGRVITDPMLKGCKITGHETSVCEQRSHSLSTIDRRDKAQAWANWPTQPPVCNGYDGLSARLDGITFPKWRNESIKAGGNAIVPQLAYEIFKVIDQLESGDL